VNTGGQQPRRLWTKDEQLVGQLAFMVGQHTAFYCGVSHWTNQQGQPVRSLWINGVGQAGAVATPSVAPQPVQQQYVPTPVPVQAPLPQPVQQMQGQMLPQVAMQQPRQDWEQVREGRIMRQTATKVAAILISHVPAEQRTLENVIMLADRLVGYYEQTAPAGNPGHDGGGGVHPGAYDEPGAQGIPHTDDDIPF